MKIQNSLDFRPLRAGVGRCDITTEDPERRVRDRLFAKALVFDDGSVRLAIVTMDAVAIGGICEIGDDFLPQLRERVERELGIPGSHVMVNASHTHPPEPILCPAEALLERTFNAIREATANLVAVRVGAGAGREDRISMNRDLRLKDGRHWSIRHANPCPPDEEVAGVGPVDPEIGILRVDRLDGTPLAAVYHFACHLLFGDPESSVTANFTGIASRLIEDCVGHGVTAFFLQGACGDVIDVGFKDFSRCRDIEPFGLMLGAGVLRPFGQIPTGPGRIGIISERITLPRRSDSATHMERLRCEQQALLDSLRFTSLNLDSFLRLYLQHSLRPDYPAADAYAYLQAASIGNTDLVAMDAFNRKQIEKYLHGIRVMERLAAIQDELATFARHEEINAKSGSKTVDAEIQGLRIGEFVLLSAPIEVLVEVGLAIKKASPHPYTYVTGFSNGYLHYGSRSDAYDKGGYEVTECFLAPEWQAIFEARSHDILQRI